MRLSVTDLDQYLYWLSMDDAGPEWLVDRLTIFEPSPAMQAGSAFHAALERLPNSASLLVHEVVKENKTGELSWEDMAADRKTYRFAFKCDAEIVLPSQRELKIEREILPGIILVGKIDGIDGNRIVDYKLTERLDVERYADSMQWRSYLMLFETNEFEYSIFEGRPDRGRELDYTIHAHHSLKFYRYPGMDSDVRKCAGELAKFIQQHNVKAKMLRELLTHEILRINLRASNASERL